MLEAIPHVRLEICAIEISDPLPESKIMYQ
jgi:hypothetical protein